MINIRCEFCRMDLHPLLLKQAVKTPEGMLYDVECINPECRMHNWVSEPFYLQIRKDYFKPYLPRLNNKLPSEMNVIFCSMNRMGISWIIRTLSQYHEGIFGVPIKFVSKVNTEISHVKATRNRLPLPQGWNNIYDVDVHALLNKNYKSQQYDKVVLVQRELHEVMKASLIYWKAQGLNSDQIEKLFDKIPENYKKVYGMEDPDDPRFIRITLEELNNYTKRSFTKLMNFLNFPLFGRPPILPVAVNRNWEVFSSVLEKDEKLGNLLQRVKKIEDEAKNIEFNVDKMIKDITLNKILIIGPRIHKRCHFSENISYAFQEKGYIAEVLPLEKLGYGDPNNKYYKSKEKLYPLSKALPYAEMENPELIIIDEPAWIFYNDVDIPVFYNHREFKRPPKVYYPDVAFFWHEGVENYFRSMFAPHWIANVPKTRILPIAVDLNVYKPESKKYKGINMLGGRESLKACLDMKELTHMGMVYLLKKELTEYVNAGLPYLESEVGGLTDEEYRDILPKCEGLFVHMPRGQYTTRRMIEAMACKVVCFIIIENEEHREILARMGFIAGKNFIEVESIEQLVNLHKKFKYKNYKDIVENAYEVVINNHTFHNRADRLIELYKEYALRFKGIVV